MIDARATTKDIKLAVQSITWNIPRGEQFEPFLDEAVEAGYEGVALFAFQLEDFIDDPAYLETQLGKRGLSLAGITGFVTDTPEWAERVMKFMSIFGTRHLACTDFDSTLTIPRAVEILDHRAEVGDRYGINVYYHNHTGGVGETMTEVEEIRTKLDPAHFHFMLDVGHATKDFPEVPPADRAADFLERNWSDIEYLELKDWNEVTDLNTPIGEGYADYDRIFTLISERGYPGGWLTVEQNGNQGLSKGRSPLQSARASRQFLTRYGF